MPRPKGSFAEQLDNLEAGQSIALAKRLAFDEFFDPEVIETWFDETRATVSSYLHRLRKDASSAEFANESFTAINGERTAVIASIVITRTK